MSKKLVLPAKPANDEEATVRLDAYLASWRASLSSTEPADRPAAEAAINGLYRNVGLKEPRIVWVGSPLAGALVYQSIGRDFAKVRSPYATGEVGTGSGREFNALRDPFGFPTLIEQRYPGRVAQRVPGFLGSRIRDAFDGAGRTSEGLRAELRRRIPEAIGAQERHAEPVAVDERLGALLVGSSAESFARLVGTEVFAVVAGMAVRSAFVQHLMNDQQSTVQAMQPGLFDADTHRWALLERVLGVPFYSPRDGSLGPRQRLAHRLEIARTAGPWWALDGLAIVSERPLRNVHDARGRLHAEDGPALAFGDGFTMHAWHGVSVEPAIIEDPSSITIKAIDKETNAERRRVLVERFGLERLVREGGCVLRHEDETGRLWHRFMGTIDAWRRDEPMLMVEVLNSTPEPDGSRKAYFLRVPPQTLTAREGVAWTFGLTAEDYVPAFET